MCRLDAHGVPHPKRHHKIDFILQVILRVHPLNIHKLNNVFVCSIFGVPILIEENASQSLIDFKLEEAVSGQVNVCNDQCQ